MILNHFLVLLVLTISASGQKSHWATPDDPTAKFMIASERQWAEAACDHNRIATTILADDFLGTSTEGKRYTKAEEVADNADTSKTARYCRLLDAKVRFFGDNLAVIHGSESSMRKANDGSDKPKCQIWTDTWLKRNGKWQIIAAQDTEIACGKSN